MKYFILEFEQQIIGYLGLWIVIDQAQNYEQLQSMIIIEAMV